MIICQKCGKENQDHYRFCLGCGSAISKDMAKPAVAPAPAPAPVVQAPVPAQPKPQPQPVVQAPVPVVAPAPVPQPFAAPPSAPVQPAAAPYVAPVAAAPAPAAGAGCPQCNHVNPAGTRFCMSCGFNLSSLNVAPPPPAPTAPVAMLTVLRADKSEGGSYSFGTTTVIGRDTGGIFAGDSYLSPRHATFINRNGRWYLHDEASLNGTFLKLAPEQTIELKPGDVFRIGQEIIRFEPISPQPAAPDGVERLGSPSKGYVGRLALVIGRDVTGNAFPVPEAGVHLGRERGDILFPEDGYVSGLHCKLRYEAGHVMLGDLGSSNGTFFRLTTEYELKHRDEILMGQQLFRFSLPSAA